MTENRWAEEAIKRDYARRRELDEEFATLKGFAHALTVTMGVTFEVVTDVGGNYRIALSTQPGTLIDLAKAINRHE